MTKVIKKIVKKDEKTYTQLVLKFDDGFEVYVSPSFKLSEKAYKAFMSHVNNYISIEEKSE